MRFHPTHVCGHQYLGGGAGIQRGWHCTPSAQPTPTSGLFFSRPKFFFVHRKFTRHMHACPLIQASGACEVG